MKTKISGRTIVLSLVVMVITALTAAAADTTAPIVSQILANPSVVSIGGRTTLVANVSDFMTGNSNISGVDYSIAGGPWISMSASDGGFDSSSETVLATTGVFPAAGVYVACIQGRDSAGNTSTPDCSTLIPVYDPQAGFVTGGGWIQSPPGAYRPDTALSGKATFGFVSKYVNGAQNPSGNTQFQFHAAGFDFQSIDYDWLVISGPKAQYKGSGAVNGNTGYTFLLTATDGDVQGGGGVDKFRIKVWNANGVVYDNVYGALDDLDNTNPQAIGGGSIVIHRSGSSSIPDLVLTKLASANPVAAGKSLTYTLIVANQGTAPATGVVLKDTLPSGVSFVSASTGCTNQSNTITCNLGQLTAGASVTVTVVVTVNLKSGTITNSANVSATEAESSTANNTASVATQVIAPDVTVAKTATPEPAGSGGTLTYTLSVTNRGSAAAEQVTLTDALPAGEVFISASAGCAATAPVTCNLGTLSGGATVAVSISAKVTAASGAITNTANVNTTSVESDTTNNSASWTTHLGSADLAITKTAPALVAAGGSVTYTIKVDNIGLIPADAVVVTDTLPIGVTFASASGGCNNNSGSVTCSLGSIPNGGATTVVITVNVTVTSGSITNTATVTTTTTESNTGNNTATAVVNVFAVADLTITKTSSPNPVAGNAVFTYQVIVTNQGNAPADNVTITDTLPTGVRFVSASAGCSESAGRVTCNLGRLDVGANGTASIQVRAPSTATTLTNTATVTTTSPETSTSNNSATDTTSVISAPDLVVTNIDDPDPVGQGGLLTDTITVTNEGIAPADGVVLRDIVPFDDLQKFSIVSTTSTVGTCAPTSSNPPTITCQIGTLLPGASAVFTAVVRINVATGNLTNTATATTTTSEPNTANNTAVATTTIGGPDIVMIKTAPELVPPGGLLTYALSVSNAGTADATDVVVTDALPAGVSFVSATSPCTQNNGIVTCTLGSLPQGGNVELTIQTTAIATSGNITNTATVSSSSADTNAANNSATAATQIAVADLSVIKVATPNPVGTGGMLTYTIEVRNDGTAPAEQVVATDTLPAGVTFVSANSGCSFASGIVTCALGTIDSPSKGTNNSRLLQIQVTAPATPGTVTNTVHVSTASAEPNTTNNTAAVITTVAAADLALTKTASPNPVAQGNTLRYVLTVTNTGLAPAEHVTLTDNLQGVGSISLPGKLSCSLTGTLLTCDLGTVSPGNIIEVEVTAIVTAGSGTLTNTATVTTSTTESTLGNNTATTTVTVYIPGTGIADLILSKGSTPNPVAGNAVFTYQVNVTNQGTAPADNVTITDTLPSGLRFVSASPGCNESAGVVTCNVGRLDVGASGTASIQVRAPSTPTTLTNTATVTTTSPESSTSNNSATDTTGVISAPDLVVTNIDNPDPVGLGGFLTLTVTVTNEGIAPADGVVLRDMIPLSDLSKFSIVSTSSTVGTCAPTSTNPPTITCQVGTLLPGASAVFAIVVRINVTTGNLTNTATATTTTSEPNTANNTAVATANIGGPDVVISKTAPDVTLTGSLLTYTLSVSNTGTADAADVVVTDALPAGVSFVSASSPCTQNNGVVTCNLGTLAPQSTTNLSIQATVVAASGPINNSATVTTSSVETSTANNTSSVTTTVVVLSLTKTASPDPVLPNHTLTYTLTVTNVGPATVPNVSIVDFLPGAVQFLSASVNCSGDKTLSCDIGDLAAGMSRTISIQSIVIAGNGTISNSAFATSGGQPASNTATSLTTIAVADLVLSKLSSPTVAGNSTLTYQLTATNRGAAPAEDVVILDTLPAGVQFVSSSPNCSGNTCSPGTIGPGLSASATITVKVNATTGILVNKAHVSTSTFESDFDNNDASFTSSIVPADVMITKVALSNPVPVGSNVTFAITVMNIGASAAENVVVGDTMPPTMEFVGADIECFSGSVRTASCELGDLSAGQSFSFNIVGRVIDFANTAQTNTATVTTTSNESNTANNTSSATIGLLAPDLTISKTANASQVLIGSDVTYTLTVTNQGSADAGNVTVTDLLPGQLIFVSASSGCSNTVSFVTCSLGTVQAGATASVTITAKAPPVTTTITNSGSVSTPDREKSTQNNTATVTIDVIAADLSISFNNPPAQVSRLSSVTYTLTLENVGRASAANVVVRESLPQGVSFQNATGCLPAFDPGTRTLTCDAGTLFAGASRSITITVFVGDVPGITLTNTVTATTPTAESDLSNNSATAVTTVF